MPLSAGSPVPHFALRDQHGRTVSPSTYAGAPLLVVFYPWAFSRVCTGELRVLRDGASPLRQTGAAVVAVSCDPMFSLRAFADAEGIDIPLLSDHWPHGAAARAFGVFDEETGAARRSTFLVAGGIVTWAVHAGLDSARDLQEYLEAVRRLGGPQEGGGHRERERKESV